MKKLLFILLFFCGLVVGGKAESKVPGIFGTNPGTKNASISALVINSSTGQIVDEYQPDLVLAPASCTKLITTATALELMGADYCFSTYLETDASIVNGELKGNLYIRGTGDPTLGSKDLGDRSFMQKWVNALRRLGITSITGDIVADLSFMDDEATNPAWQWEDMGNYYAPGISAIAYLDNTMVICLRSGEEGHGVQVVSTNPVYPGLTFQNAIKAAPISYDDAYVHGVPFSDQRYLRGRVPAHRNTFGLKGDIPNPGFLLASHLRDALQSAGISVNGEATYTFDADPEKRTILYQQRSEPLSEIVKVTNIDSNNLYAEQIFRLLGSRMGSPATIQNSLDVERSCWSNRRVDFQAAIINDGCGLAPSNAVSARQLVGLLSYMHKSKNYQALYESLPVSGESGTLKGVLAKTPLQGRVHAKSGTIAHVRSYAGYIELENGNTYTFAIIVNNASCKSRVTRSLLEKYLLAVSGYDKK